MKPLYNNIIDLDRMEAKRAMIARLCPAQADACKEPLETVTYLVIPDDHAQFCYKRRDDDYVGDAPLYRKDGSHLRYQGFKSEAATQAEESITRAYELGRVYYTGFITLTNQFLDEHRVMVIAYTN